MFCRMRILIIADQALFRQGLRTLLQVLRPESQVAELAGLDAAVDAPGPAPDLVLIKLADSGPERCAPLTRLRQHFDAAVLVALSAVPDAALMREALEAGAGGYLPGTIDPTSSMEALQQVLCQGIYLPPALVASRPGSRPAEAAPPQLQPAEQRLLLPLLQGLPEAVLSRRLGCGVATLRRDIAALWRRLGVADRVQALYLLGASGWAGVPRWQEGLGHGD
jgi:DNA-binding NarL/FixJ family response regulator